MYFIFRLGSSLDELIDYFISTTMTEKVVMIKNIVEERFAGESAFTTYILENDINILQRKEYLI